jgi:hypothetical protein
LLIDDEPVDPTAQTLPKDDFFKAYPDLQE